jgi:hypothetical protein
MHATRISCHIVIYCVRYYPWFHVTTVGLGTYYPAIRWSACTLLYSTFISNLCSTRINKFLAWDTGSIHVNITIQYTGTIHVNMTIQYTGAIHVNMTIQYTGSIHVNMTIQYTGAIHVNMTTVYRHNPCQYDNTVYRHNPCQYDNTVYRHNTVHISQKFPKT